MEIVQSQNAFTSGEMDPKLRARSDIQQYKDGLATARNITIQPQGGAKRRPGSRYIATLPASAASGVRLVPFEFSVTTSYMLAFVDQRMYVFKDGALITNINGSGLDYLAVSAVTSAVLNDMCWTQSYDTLILTQQTLAPLRIVRGGTDATWTASTITFSNIPQYDFGSGAENTWSVTRGWPRTVVFYQGRLYLGGTSTRPSTIWGSQVGDYFNFSFGTSLADEAVEATLDVGRFNGITDLYAGRNLQIFTTGGEFFVPQTTDDPITPQTFFVKQQTENGSATGIRVVNVEGGTIFLQRQGKALAEFLYNDVQAAYTAAKISLLSSHLLRSPIEMCVRRATSTDEGDRLLLVNGEDGTIACYTLLRSQNVIAPSIWDTDGLFIGVGVDVDDTYVVVERSINSSLVYYVELLEEDLLLDCARQATGAASSVSTLAHLNGETVRIIRDGILETSQVVSGGTITFATPATASYEIGLDFTVQITTLPVATRTQAGSVRASKKRIFDIFADLFETQSLTIAGKEIQFRQFGDAILDSAVEPYTGLKEVPVLLGYSEDASITITQGQPLKMTVLGLEYKVSVG